VSATGHTDLGFARRLDLARESDVRKAVRAYARTLKPHSDYYFNEEAAVRSILFFPQQCRLTKGPLAGRPLVLQPWQAFEIVAPVQGWRADDGTRRYRRASIWLPRKNGKALALDTPVPTPSGWSTMGALAVGDEVFTATGTRTLVTATSDVMVGRPCYEVAFSNGETIVADADHMWLTTARIDGFGLGQTRVRNTADIAATVTTGARGDRNHSLAMPAALSLPPAALPIDPYVLGLWIGDGHRGHAAIACGDADVDEIASLVKYAGYATHARREASAWRVSIFARDADRWNGRASTQSEDNLQIRLRALGVLDTKAVPGLYLRASATQRLALLQGLMDSDGHCAASGRILELSTTDRVLANGYRELLASLGVKHSCRETALRCNGRDVGGRGFRIQFWVDAGDLPVFRLTRKLERQRANSSGAPGRSRTVQIVSVRPVSSVPVRCIAVEHPSRLFLVGQTMLPTHNTELMAGTALQHLLCDGEWGGEGYCVAVKAEQAQILFTAARAMVRLNPDLARVLEPFADSLWHEGSFSSLKVLGGRAEGTHGKGPSFRIADELHEFKDDRLLQFLDTGMGARLQPMAWDISTAGVQQGYGWELWNTCRQLADGVIKDDRSLVVIYAADEEDDPWSPDTWAKANPNLGVSILPANMRDAAQRALRSSRSENDFKRYNLNLWTGQVTRWLKMDRWIACASSRASDAWRGDEARLAGRPCFGGVDLASTKDFCALVWVFPPHAGDGWRVLCRFWLPGAELEDRIRQERVPYDLWRDDGALVITEGDAADHDAIRAQILADIERFDVQGLGFDPWNAHKIMVELNEIYPDMAVRVAQSMASLTGPSKLLERLVLKGEIDHGNHPVLRWMADNVATVTDSSGNIKPAKNKSTQKIDGIVALIIALALTQQPADSGTPSGFALSL
jgi:phage terminase large subunit-like protein